MPTSTTSRAESFTIGGLSKQSGVKVETIRYYERIKILRAPARSASGSRIYDRDDLRALAFIRRSRELGFSLNEIRALLRLGAPENASCGDVRAIAIDHLKNIQTKISDLTKLKRHLANAISRCSGNAMPECPVIDILDIRRSR